MTRVSGKVTDMDLDRSEATKAACPAAPTPAELAPTLDAADIGEDREHVEQVAEHVASLGDPRDRLDAQRMDRENQGGQRRAERDRPAPQVLHTASPLGAERAG